MWWGMVWEKSEQKGNSHDTMCPALVVRDQKLSDTAPIFDSDKQGQALNRVWKGSTISCILSGYINRWDRQKTIYSVSSKAVVLSYLKQKPIWELWSIFTVYGLSYVPTMWVCVCLSVYTCVCVCVWECVHVCVCSAMWGYMCSCVCVCEYLFVLPITVYYKHTHNLCLPLCCCHGDSKHGQIGRASCRERV